jgi:hypothetical protein
LNVSSVNALLEYLVMELEETSDDRLFQFLMKIDQVKAACTTDEALSSDNAM